MPLTQSNNAGEIENLFKEYHALLCLVAFEILKDQAVAKDIVQDFFVSYWLRRKSVTIKISFKAYAIRAVKNLSICFLEKRKREKFLLRDLKVGKSEEPEGIFKANEKSKVYALLNQLPESRKQIFVSAILNGQSYSEIAESRGISVNTVKTQIKRAYAFLRSEATENLISFVLGYIFIIGI